MKINKNRPGYITVQGQRIRTTGREISLHEVVNDDGQKGVALRLNGKDVEIHKLTIQEYTFLMSAVNFMVIDVLTPLMLVQGASANDVYECLDKLADAGVSAFDRRIPADMQDEAQRFADYIDKQGLTEDEMTVEKMQELMEKFKNENAG